MLTLRLGATPLVILFVTSSFLAASIFLGPGIEQKRSTLVADPGVLEGRVHPASKF